MTSEKSKYKYLDLNEYQFTETVKKKGFTPPPPHPLLSLQTKSLSYVSDKEVGMVKNGEVEVKRKISLNFNYKI